MPQAKIKCQKCGSLNHIQNIFCLSCGIKLVKKARKTVIPGRRNKIKDKKKISSNFSLSFFINIFTISIGIVCLALIIYPLPLKNQPRLLGNYQSFQQKIETYPKPAEIFFTPQEIAAYIKETVLKEKKIFITGKKENPILIFPSNVFVAFEKDNFYLFLPLKIVTFDIFLGFRGIFYVKNDKTLTLNFNNIVLGKLVIPSFIVKPLIEMLSIKAMYRLPHFVKDISIKNDRLCIKTTTKIISKKEEQPEISFGEESDSSEEKTYYYDDEFEEDIAQEEVDKEEASEKQPSVSEKKIETGLETEAKDVKKIQEEQEQKIAPPLFFADSEAEEEKEADVEKPSPSRLSSEEKEATKLHKLGNYFYRKKHYSLALKYYGQVAQKFPLYSKITVVKEIIEEIKLKNKDNGR
ncbi:hypothetical protein ACFLQ1_01250 [Candidatus Auribacterota bacterium]